MCFVCKLTNDSLKSVLHPKSLEEIINKPYSKVTIELSENYNVEELKKLLKG